MKISIVTLLFCFFIAESSFANGFKTGVYGSNNGDVHLITSRSGGKALGLYNTRGHVLLSGLSISGRATLFTGSFANGKTKGMVAFKKVNDKKWDGDWKYNRSNLPPRKWNGSWDGWYKNNNKLGGLYLWNTFKTDLGTMELIHNASGKVGGFLYANGKEYFVYGQLQGSNLKTFKGYISSDSEAIDVSPNYTLTFTWNNGMYGTATIPGKSRRTFRGATKQKRLKITLINIKNYENTGITHGSEWGKAKLNLEGVDEKGRLFKKDLYEDTKNIKWEENKTKLINKVFEHNLIYSSTNSGYYHNPKLYFNFDYKKMRSISNSDDPLADIDKIELKPLIDYMEFRRPASSFSNASDGRKRIPESDHTFWLGDDGGNTRMVKGYAFKKYSKNNKWGYFYFIELID